MKAAMELNLIRLQSHLLSWKEKKNCLGFSNNFLHPLFPVNITFLPFHKSIIISLAQLKKAVRNVPCTSWQHFHFKSAGNYIVSKLECH